MRGVVRANIGTANDELGDLSIPVYGKTGTAENPLGDSHAWFTGYTGAGRADKPDIAVTVIVENGGEGSEVGAPVFRRIIETYFYGEPLKLYPWESDFYVTRTPTPEFTPTPLPGEEPPAPLLRFLWRPAGHSTYTGRVRNIARIGHTPAGWILYSAI